MSAKQLFAGIGTAAVFAAAIVGATFLASPNLSADDEHSANDKGRIEVGLQVAPVPLTYDKHDRDMVGLGSYLVNVNIGCNGCHSAGPTTDTRQGIILIRGLVHLRRRRL